LAVEEWLRGGDLLSRGESWGGTRKGLILLDEMVVGAVA